MCRVGPDSPTSVVAAHPPHPTPRWRALAVIVFPRENETDHGQSQKKMKAEPIE